MNPRLKQLLVSDFRSIRGEILIPLDANIVLIHGANGTGKTSLLSALELSLTGRLSSLESTGKDYPRHLLHDGAHRGRVAIELEESRQIHRTTIEVHPNRFSGDSALNPELAQFYSERSYLAQSTLGRLLELYQASDQRGETLLTRFVNDLLKLDRLDAIIDGLSSSTDVRNARKQIPEFVRYEKTLERLKVEDRSRRQTVGEIETELNEIRQMVSKAREGLGQLGPDIKTDVDKESILVELNSINQLHAEIDTLSQLLDGEDLVVETTNLEEAESALSSSAGRWKVWQDEWAPLLVRLVSSVESELGTKAPSLPEDPNAISAWLTSELTTAIGATKGAIARDARLEDEVKSVSAELAETETLISQHRVRAEGLARNEGANGLGEALAAILPHISGDECPVCGRDYAEVSKGSLRSHVRRASIGLSALAVELEAAERQLSVLESTASRLVESKESLRARMRPAFQQIRSKESLKSFEKIQNGVDRFNENLRAGSNLWRQYRGAQQRLSTLQLRSQNALAVRERIVTIGSDLGLAGLAELPLSQSMIRVKHDLENRRTSLQRKSDSLTMLTDALRREARISEELESAKEQLRSIEEETQELEKRIRGAKGRIEAARGLRNAALSIKREVVEEVFNERLNDTWRGMFGRLAPSEPFAPCFTTAVHDKTNSNPAVQVIHRNSRRMGPPSALLSAGNLNTAALTLFLSLHLAAEPKLPWLILDDPVQAMDDIHISNFAALIRTLATSASRQVVLAVHERSLFDYLSLELSPASPSQKLITVELSRRSVGDTTVRSETVSWEPDRAIAK